MTSSLARMRSARGLVLAVLVAMALAVSGCVEVAFESEFEEDGSARHSFAMTVDREFAEDEMFGEEIDFEEMIEEAEAAGLDAEEIDDPDRVGVRISTVVDDNEDLGAAMNDLFGALDPEVEDIEAFEGSFTIVEDDAEVTYIFELTVDGDILFEDEEEIDDAFGMEMMRQFFNLTYTVHMPGTLVDHNGTELDDGRVQWDLPFSGRSTFAAESRDGDDVTAPEPTPTAEAEPEEIDDDAAVDTAAIEESIAQVETSVSGQIADLEGTIGAQNDQIQALESNLEERLERIDELEQSVAQQETLIAGHQSDIDSLSNRLLLLGIIGAVIVLALLAAVAFLIARTATAPEPVPAAAPPPSAREYPPETRPVDPDAPRVDDPDDPEATRRP